MLGQGGGRNEDGKDNDRQILTQSNATTLENIGIRENRRPHPTEVYACERNGVGELAMTTGKHVARAVWMDRTRGKGRREDCTKTL